MKRHDEELLNKAIDAVRTDKPDAEAITAAAGRISDRLGVAMKEHAAIQVIRNCDDVRELLASYREGTLPDGRSQLVKAHLSDCGACLRYFREGSRAAKVDWSAPAAPVRRSLAVRPTRNLGWALAFSFALILSAAFLYKTYWAVPAGVRAEVQSIDGSAYLISAAGDRKLAPGEALREGDRLRTSGASHAVLRLSDGSTVEVNERSALEVGARGRDTTVSLDGGDVIVQAAKRTSGHLYVKTPDCRVAVTGTVFSVNSGIKGSRVAVLQGAVQVTHSGVHAMLQPGDQIATSDNLNPEPLEEQFAWSADREKYVGIMAQLALVEHRIAQIPFPQPRYSSDLLARVPAGTVLYVSIPNLGEFLSQANQIFHDQLNQSPELQQWWNHGHDNHTAELDALVEKIHDVSQYLGDEAVVVGVKQGDHPGFAVLADVAKSGLADLLRKQAADAGVSGQFTVLDEQSLAAAGVTTNNGHAGYALVRPQEVVFSNDIAMLKQLDSQLSAGASGFAAGDFGKQIAAAYTRGAGIILAADLHEMMANMPAHVRVRPGNNAMVQKSGIEELRYLIAEHRETNGMPQNHLNMQFSGTRERVASWLAGPAPIGSLDFVTPNASAAVAVLSKDPKAIADDIIAMTTQSSGDSGFDEASAKLQINLRDDLMANLGGDFLLALDGPVLPTPSWKAVIEVNNAAQLENTLERLVQAINSQPQGEKPHQAAIDPSDANGQRFYAVRDVASGTVFANYTFSDGFMIIAPTRALLIEAIQTHASGSSLARSAAFRALLPKDENENYSAVAYQNLSPVLTPVLSMFSGDSADAIRKLAADSRPTVICAFGRENRIEVASDSRLFGFDFLTLGALLDSRNKLSGAHVIQ
jgi:hypothetical protein